MAAVALKDPPAARTTPGNTAETGETGEPGHRTAGPGANRLHRSLLIAATLLVFFVLGLGAYVRLSDAGLGCPDWPGCYGHLLGVPDAGHEIAAAAQAYPGQPVHAGKAWKEMIHRYAAGALGILVLAIAVSAWRRQRRWAAPETGLLGLVVLQATLGMWTVTQLLKPVIVSLHLLGGMATWALLVTLLRDQLAPGRVLPLAGRLALAVLFVQIGLGGWVSSNYAGLACDSFPSCRDGLWWPPTAFGEAFALQRELGATAAGELLPHAALSAIHLAHRLGALLVLLVVGIYGWRCWRGGEDGRKAGGHDASAENIGAGIRAPAARRAGSLLLGALLLQIGLGIANVLLHLPLALAVAHNLGAATLVGVLLWTARAPAAPGQRPS